VLVKRAEENEKIAKDLRDDYTAFSLATVSYVMLLTTAMSAAGKYLGAFVPEAALQAPIAGG